MIVLRKTISLTLISIVLVCSVQAQALFTYGNTAVTRDEFLKAYRKNNPTEATAESTLREYLELYTRFKLKVRAARDLKLDTLSSQQTELESFKSQVAESFMNDDATVNAMIGEAFERSRKDIHLAHIFIPLPVDPDAAALKKAQEKIEAAYAQLSQGVAFEKVALDYSEDPSVSANKGDIGYITSLTINYELENLAYKTPAGSFTRPFRSKTGFHILKVLDERKALGRIRAAQILLAFPPDSGEDQKLQLKKRADSLYTAAVNGADFKLLAAQFSNDNLSYLNGGEMMEFGVGKYDPVFENTAFGLAKDGNISMPVQTAFGYHIIKRLELKSIKDSLAVNEKEALRQQVVQSDRMESAKRALVTKIKQLTRFKKHSFNENSFWKMTDNIFKNGNTGNLPGITPATPVFAIAGKNIVFNDWKSYINLVRGTKGAGTAKTTFEEFMNQKVMDHYRQHLENYNKDFAFQLNEFREGNLLFEVMQRKIWDKAAADSAGLRKFYQQHKDKYVWEASADAIIFTFSNEEIANRMRPTIDSNYKNWNNLVETGNGLMQADSARFELSQIPVPERTNFQENLLTANTKNETDNTVSYSYIIKMYPGNEPRNFESARGFVINDYQSYLEQQWVAELKNKYPVKINESVFKTLAN
jgi:peptidyl-prolyl cis-trans isomerase SurA